MSGSGSLIAAGMAAERAQRDARHNGGYHPAARAGGPARAPPGARPDGWTHVGFGGRGPPVRPARPSMLPRPGMGAFPGQQGGPRRSGGGPWPVPGRAPGLGRPPPPRAAAYMARGAGISGLGPPGARPRVTGIPGMGPRPRMGAWSARAPPPPHGAPPPGQPRAPGGHARAGEERSWGGHTAGGGQEGSPRERRGSRKPPPPAEPHDGVASPARSRSSRTPKSSRSNRNGSSRSKPPPPSSDPPPGAPRVVLVSSGSHSRSRSRSPSSQSKSRSPSARRRRSEPSSAQSMDASADDRSRYSSSPPASSEGRSSGVVRSGSDVGNGSMRSGSRRGQHRRLRATQADAATPNTPRSVASVPEDVNAALEEMQRRFNDQFSAMREKHRTEVERLQVAMQEHFRAELAQRDAAHAAALAEKDAQLKQAQDFLTEKLREALLEQQQDYARQLIDEQDKMKAAAAKALRDAEASLDEERAARAKDAAEWAREKAELTRKAEAGMTELHSTLTEQSKQVVTTLRAELDAAIAARDKAMAGVADEERAAFEARVQSKCDEIVKKYKALAENALAKANADREAMQLEQLERLKADEESRRKFELAVQQRASELVTAAKVEAAAAQQALETERQRVGLMEVEMRRQFEEHCRAYEAAILRKVGASLRGRVDPEASTTTSRTEGGRAGDVATPYADAMEAMLARDRAASGSNGFSDALRSPEPLPSSSRPAAGADGSQGGAGSLAASSGPPQQPTDVYDPENVAATLDSLQMLMRSLRAGAPTAPGTSGDPRVPLKATTEPQQRPRVSSDAIAQGLAEEEQRRVRRRSSEHSRGDPEATLASTAGGDANPLLAEFKKMFGEARDGGGASTSAPTSPDGGSRKSSASGSPRALPPLPPGPPPPLPPATPPKSAPPSDDEEEGGGGATSASVRAPAPPIDALSPALRDPRSRGGAPAGGGGMAHAIGVGDREVAADGTASVASAASSAASLASDALREVDTVVASLTAEEKAAWDQLQDIY